MDAKFSLHSFYVLVDGQGLTQKNREVKIQFVSQIVAYFFMFFTRYFQITRDYLILLSRFLYISVLIYLDNKLEYGPNWVKK